MASSGLLLLPLPELNQINDKERFQRIFGSLPGTTWADMLRRSDVKHQIHLVNTYVIEIGGKRRGSNVNGAIIFHMSVMVLQSIADEDGRTKFLVRPAPLISTNFLVVTVL